MAELTIDELARASGMTVRNIRAHQSRGLLPPPRLRGRTGFYDETHVERLEVIKELQSQGFNLEAIRRLLQGSDGATPEDVLAFTRKVGEPFQDEEPEVVRVEELFSRWGDYASPELLQRAYKLGMIREREEGDGLELRSPRLDRAGRELVSLGISPLPGIDVLVRAKTHLEAIAKGYVELFLDEVWRPFDAAGRPEEDWPAVYDALERLRPLAIESITAVFGVLMTDAVHEAMGQEVERLQRAL